MSRLKLGVVGAGAWGRNHVRTVATLPDAELTAVCDRDPKVRERVARQYPVTHVTGELVDLLARVDAVIEFTRCGADQLSCSTFDDATSPEKLSPSCKGFHAEAQSVAPSPATIATTCGGAEPGRSDLSAGASKTLMVWMERRARSG